MARSLNKAMLIGNVGSDPEIRTFQNGGRVAQFSLATSRRWNDRNTGQTQEKTEWHRIVASDKPFNLVDIVERYVKKGDKLFVEGEIEYRQYQDSKDNSTKYITEIRAREILLLGGKGDGDGGGGWDRSRSGAASGGRSGGGGGGGGGGGAGRGSDYDDFQAPPLEEDDDLPF